MKPLFAVVLLLPAVVAAKSKVIVDAPKQIGPAIEKALKAKYTVTKQSLPPEPTGGDIQAACREAGGAIAVVTARPGGDLFTVMVLSGADGSPLSTFRVKGGKKPVKALSKPDVKKLLGGVSEGKAPKKEEAKPPPEEAKPPPPEEKKPEEKKPEPVAEEKPKPKAERTVSEAPPPPAEELREAEPAPRRATKKPMALRLGVGMKVFNRLFGYTDDIFESHSTYYLPRGPAIAAEAELYPAAFLTDGFAAHIGLMGQFTYALGIASRSEDGTRYGTTAIGVRALLTARIPISVLTIQPFFGFARQTYAIGAPQANMGMMATPRPNVPTVLYNGLRAGGQLRFNIFGPVALSLYGAYIAILSTGEIGTFFPKSRTGGMDAGGALTVSIADRLEIKVGGEYMRFWYSMNSVPGDEHVAGGALDIFVSGNFMLSFML